MLDFRVASGFMISRLWIITRMVDYFNIRRRHQFHILDSLSLKSIKKEIKYEVASLQLPVRYP